MSLQPAFVVFFSALASLTASGASALPFGCAGIGSTGIAPFRLGLEGLEQSAAPRKPSDAAGNAQQSVTVVSSGLGSTPKAALDNALQAAVSQALGRLIHADTLVENDRVIHERILSATSGFIEKFEKLSEEVVEGLYSVRIKAEVRSEKLRTEVASKVEGARGVDGQSLRARIVTRAASIADSRELVSALLSHFPKDLLQVRTLGDPEAVEGVKLPEGITRLRMPIEVSIDEALWSKRCAEVNRALEVVAVASRTTSMRLRPRTLAPSDESGFCDAMDGKFLVCRALDGADWKGASPPAGQLHTSRISQASYLLKDAKEWDSEAISQCWELYSALDRSVAEHAAKRLNRPLESVFVVHGNLRTGVLSVSTHAVPADIIDGAMQSFKGTLAVVVLALDANGTEISKQQHDFTLAPARSYWSDEQSAKGGSGGFRSDGGSNPSFLLVGRGERARSASRGGAVMESMVVPGAFVEDGCGSATIEFGVIHAWRGNLYLDLPTSEIEAVRQVRCVIEMR